MRTLSASEIKRRGIVAVEELLSQGPVHILKNSRTACVAMSEQQFAQLTAGALRRKAPSSAWEILLAPAANSGAPRRKVDAKLKAERDAWDKK
jgi:PHD/YefM family antitoxin component YafN of YafNO toxin-antitoxin module